MKWDKWIGSLDGVPTLFIKTLLRWRGRVVRLHKIVTPDGEGMFHSHPARAIRVVLWGGYVEEIYNPDSPTRTFKSCLPGSVSFVSPDLTHRIHRLIEGPSYSLWIRGRERAKVRLKGDGWPEHLRNKEV